MFKKFTFHWTAKTKKIEIKKYCMRSQSHNLNTKLNYDKILQIKVKYMQLILAYVLHQNFVYFQLPTRIPNNALRRYQ